MTRNLGNKDRIIRAILVVVMLLGAITASNTIFSILMAVVGLYALFTAVTGHCFIFKAMGHNSFEAERTGR